MTGKVLISPSILSSDFSQLGQEVEDITEAGADLIHIDVMDGNFVPNLTFGTPVIKAIRNRTDLPFDVHLMIERPERYIEDYVNAGADIITVHCEATVHLHRVLQQIHSFGKRAGVSLDPSTSPDFIKYIIDDLDMILVMSVNPGFGGQKFIPSSVEKIKAIRNMSKDIDIEVDGGINEKTIVECEKAGANIFVAGSYIFSGDYQNRINDLRSAIQKSKME